MIFPIRPPTNFPNSLQSKSLSKSKYSASWLNRKIGVTFPDCYCKASSVTFFSRVLQRLHLYKLCVISRLRLPTVLVLLLSAGPIWWQVTARDRSWSPIVFCCCSIDDNDEPSLWLKTHEGHFQLWENMPRLSFHESSTASLSVNDLKLCNSAHPSFWFQRCESTISKTFVCKLPQHDAFWYQSIEDDLENVFLTPLLQINYNNAPQALAHCTTSPASLGQKVIS